jgi:hypothetical protein
MRELVRACADAEYACGEWWGDEAKRGDFIAAQTRAEKARAALLSAIDHLIDSAAEQETPGVVTDTQE